MDNAPVEHPAIKPETVARARVQFLDVHDVKQQSTATRAHHHRRTRTRNPDSTRRFKQLRIMYPSRLFGGGPGPAAG